MDPFFFIYLFFLLAPVVTSLLLAMAMLKPGTSLGRSSLFHLITMPAVFGLMLLCLRVLHITLSALWFYTVFITAMYLYLQVTHAIRRFRDRQQ